MTTQALAGLRVIEMTEAWAGPVGASLLGDMGADVVKVESYPRSSMTRPVLPREATMPGDGPPYERDALHHQGNRNKRNVCLDVRTPGGAEVLRRLVAGADLFIEGYSAGTIGALGFGWEAVHALNPRTCMISLAGWGVEGTYAGKVTLGAGLDATCGHMAARGYPDGPMEDVRSNFHSDATGAATVVCAAITALEQRERTGEGCFTDFSQWEGLVWQFPGLLGEWTMNGRLPRASGTATRTWFRTAPTPPRATTSGWRSPPRMTRSGRGSRERWGGPSGPRRRTRGPRCWAGCASAKPSTTRSPSARASIPPSRSRTRCRRRARSRRRSSPRRRC